MDLEPSTASLNTNGLTDDMTSKKYLQSLLGLLRNHFSLVSLLFIILFYIVAGQNNNLWRENRVIQNDVVWYYSYLPAAFIHKDPFWGFYKKDKEHYDLKGQYWAYETPKGEYVPKMSMGKAMMDLPFFFVADIYTNNFSNSPRDGFSTPYQYMMMWATVFYGLLGFIFLWKWLKRYYNEWIVGFTLLAIAFGTNIYFYSVSEVGMSHPYNFCLFAMALYIYPKWLERISLKKSLFLGIVIGLMILIRPINILFLLPLFILNKPVNYSFLEYIKSIFSSRNFYYAVLFAFLVWAPQLLFWKVQSGQWLYYSYINEHFFWLKPHVFEGLFSFRKGWFIYTPMMIVAIFGILRLYKSNRQAFIAIALFLPLFLYVTFSWWCWWYGGGFGARTLIDILPLMALPLAASFKWILERKWRLFLFVFPVFFMMLNYYQSWQYAHGIIHYEAMTYQGYKTVFLKRYTPHGYWEQLVTPDYENSRQYGEEKEVIPLQ